MAAFEAGEAWLDPVVDGVTVYEPGEPEPGSLLPEGTDPAKRGDEVDPEFQNLVVAFVECLTARDFEGIEELLADEVEANLLSTHDREATVQGLEDLVERYPSLVLTRGEIGEEPVAGAWVSDSDTGAYDLVGIMRFGATDGREARLDRIDLVEIDESEDLVLERPEPEELAEWEDWSITDEG
ncbi:MAG: hypothetical protein R6X29_05385 [Acidimicrobiia bacterium]|jgi:hypothetical protein